MLVIAHRGFGEPENSLKAIKRAVKIGCDGVEIDVRKCADEVVCIHDATLDRTSPASGSVVLYPYKKIKKYGIPRLEDVVKYAKKEAVPLHLHIKEGDIIDEVINCLEKHGLIAEILTRETSVAIKARKHDLPVRFNSHYRMLDFCKKIGVYAIDIRTKRPLGFGFGTLSGKPFTVTLDEDYDEGWIRMVKKEGFKAVYWLRDIRLLPHSEEVGIDAVTTDDPVSVLKSLNRFGKRSNNSLFELR